MCHPRLLRHPDRNNSEAEGSLSEKTKGFLGGSLPRAIAEGLGMTRRTGFPPEFNPLGLDTGRE